ncbi:MAG: hypothetical protein R2733_16425 [Acidimicrobiales bacterium]
MSIVSRRSVRSPGLVALAAILALGGCTSSPEVAAPTIDEVVAAHVDAGMQQAVADCLVGIGSQELPLATLLPGADRSAADDALVAELTSSCQEAAAFVLDEPIEPDTLAFDDQPFTFGDNPLFDRLWERCEAGDGASCDRLWEKAPVGSDYERFGVTCGDRDQLLDCTEELTEETVAEIDAAAEAKVAAREARVDSTPSTTEPE